MGLAAQACSFRHRLHASAAWPLLAMWAFLRESPRSGLLSPFRGYHWPITPTYIHQAWSLIGTIFPEADRFSVPQIQMVVRTVSLLLLSLVNCGQFVVCTWHRALSALSILSTMHYALCNIICNHPTQSIVFLATSTVIRCLGPFDEHE